MRFYLEELEVLFPYDFIYPEQFEYMLELKRGLDRKGHLLLEMPSGTGKTISLLSLLVAYWNAYGEGGKVIYCTRTVAEMQKVLEELRRLVAYWKQCGVSLKPLLALGLSARKNMCVNETVYGHAMGAQVDAACRKLTASWVRDIEDMGGDNTNTKGCPYYSTVASETSQGRGLLPSGVYTLEDLRRTGVARGLCPYWVARNSIQQADFLVHSYTYLVDPKLSAVVSSKLPGNSIVVLDEGHNVDDVCIEALSVTITQRDVETAQRGNLDELRKLHQDMERNNAQKLRDEYEKLVRGLATEGMADVDQVLNPPQLLQDMEKEAVSGVMRRADHFLNMMRKVVGFLNKFIFNMKVVYICTPPTLLETMKEEIGVEAAQLKFCSERLRLLMNTLEVAELYNFRHISLIADFVTLLATYSKEGFSVIFEPNDPTNIQRTPEKVLQLACLDASVAMKEVFQHYHNVVLTSGTLSPLDIYPKILGFTPALPARSFKMTLTRECLAPIIVTRGSDQTTMSTELVELNTSYRTRQNDSLQPSVVSNYGKLVVNLASVVPDGMVCFFTGYMYMGKILHAWMQSGIIAELTKTKLLFIETQDVEETAMALANYRRACDIGRGAIFFSIARGKIAEGIDFDSHYGRAVVMLGVPFLPPEVRSLNERKKWMETNLKIKESEYVTFDAMRQTAQCIGRVIRNKSDYGVMVLADRRYMSHEKVSKFPQWISQAFGENTNVSSDACVSIAERFFRAMGQRRDTAADIGRSLYSVADLERLGAHVARQGVLGRREAAGYIPERGAMMAVEENPPKRSKKQ